MALIDLGVARQRIARMQIERHVEPLDRRPERPVLRQVVIDRGLRVADLRKAVDQRAAKAELLDAAFEFARRAVGVLHRQRGEALKAVRPLAHLFGEIIVGLARDLGGARLDREWPAPPAR